jgi:hypothetical protein
VSIIASNSGLNPELEQFLLTAITLKTPQSSPSIFEGAKLTFEDRDRERAETRSIDNFPTTRKTLSRSAPESRDRKKKGTRRGDQVLRSQFSGVTSGVSWFRKLAHDRACRCWQWEVDRVVNTAFNEPDAERRVPVRSRQKGLEIRCSIRLSYAPMTVPSEV